MRCKLAELELAFLDSPNELDPGNRGSRVCEQLKPTHRPSARLDASVVLVHDIVQIFARAHPGTAPSRMFTPKEPQSALSRPLRIKGDDPRRPIVAQCLAKELLGGLNVAMLAQAKVDRPAMLFDSAIQVNPFAKDLDCRRRRRSKLAKQVFSVHCAARRLVATNPAINLRGGAALATNQHLAPDETGQLGT
jgi:hypothetical protein